MSEPRIVSISPIHPNRDYTGPAYVRVAVDTGLKSGKVTLIRMTGHEAVRWGGELVTNAYRVLPPEGGTTQ